jgi:hypothetical protein
MLNHAVIFEKLLGHDYSYMIWLIIPVSSSDESALA